MRYLIVKLARILIVAVDAGGRFARLVQFIANIWSCRGTLAAWVQRFGTPLIFNVFQGFVCMGPCSRTNNYTLAKTTCQRSSLVRLRARSILIGRIMLCVDYCTLFIILDTFSACNSSHSLLNCGRCSSRHVRRRLPIHRKASAVATVDLLMQSIRRCDATPRLRRNTALQVRMKHDLECIVTLIVVGNWCRCIMRCA